MTETQRTLRQLLVDYGPQSHYSLYHIARAHGHKFSPSSVRSRVAELVRMRKAKPTDMFERTPSGRKARIWAATR